jgi:hypothetical protein
MSIPLSSTDTSDEDGEVISDSSNILLVLLVVQRYKVF